MPTIYRRNAGNRSHPGQLRWWFLVGVDGLNGFGEKVEEVTAVLAAGFDNGENRFGESAAYGALRA